MLTIQLTPFIIQELYNGKTGSHKIMNGLKKHICKEVIIPDNFQALEEAISEITECENITNEKEFFDLYEIKILKLD